MDRSSAVRDTRDRLMVIVVASHPDDPEYGLGGTINCLIDRGYLIICVILTRGERGGDPAIRVHETVAALTSLGVSPGSIHFGPFEDADLQASRDTVAYLEHFVDHNIVAAFVPTDHDSHQDHFHCNLAAKAAFRKVPSLFAYESPSAIGFSPDTYVDITDYIGAKQAALDRHATQRDKVFMGSDAIIHLASFRGAAVGVKYAEGFETIRHLLDPPTLNTAPNAQQRSNTESAAGAGRAG